MDKAALRRKVLARRAALGDGPDRSAIIQESVESLDPFRRAQIIASYVGVGAEVGTSRLIENALSRSVRVAVPWQDGKEIYLARINSLSELAPASFGLLEPPHELASLPERLVLPAHVEVMLIPGVAFDLRGGRLGHGKGFYDRLLQRAGAGPLRVALAFECQVVEDVPMFPGDERMDLLITEKTVYRVSARTASADR